MYAILLDYLENINIVVLLITYPQQSMTIAALVEIFKLMKWLAFGAIVLLTIAGVASRLIKRVKQQA